MRSEKRNGSMSTKSPTENGTGKQMSGSGRWPSLLLAPLLACATACPGQAPEPQRTELSDEELLRLFRLADEASAPPPLSDEERAERERLARESRLDERSNPPGLIPTPQGWMREGEIRLPQEGTFRPVHLRETTWVGAAETSSFAAFLFLESMMVVTTRDGQVLTFPADYSGTHPACRSIMSCIVTQEQPPGVTPWFFTMSSGLLVPIECRSEGEELAGAPVRLDQLREAVGSSFVTETADTICWNPGAVPYQLVVATAPAPPPAVTVIPMAPPENEPASP